MLTVKYLGSHTEICGPLAIIDFQRCNAIIFERFLHFFCSSLSGPESRDIPEDMPSRDRRYGLPSLPSGLMVRRASAAWSSLIEVLGSEL
jgi:hypothetical protein